MGKVTVEIEDETHLKLKLICTTKGVKIKDYVEEKMYEFNIRHWAFIGFTLKPNKIQVLHYI